MSQIGDYTVLQVAIPGIPSLPKSTTHTMYLRPHAPKMPTESDARSVFIVNVPVDSTSAHLRAVFTSLVGSGRFESASFEGERRSSSATSNNIVPSEAKLKKRKRTAEINTNLPAVWDRELRRSGSTAVVVLVDSKSVELVLKAVKKLHKKKKWPTWGEGVDDVPALGSARYSSHQKLRYPNERDLQASVDAFMENFNSAEETKAREAKIMRGVPDEDGFVTVTRGGRTGPARREEAEEKKRELEEKEARKRGEMGNFYRFQLKDRYKAEQGELIKRFEEDREKVKKMKEKSGRGGFRPEK